MKNLGIITHNFPLNPKDRQNAGIFVSDIAQELSKTNKTTVYCPGGAGRKNKIGKVKVENFSWIEGKKLGDLKFWNPFDLIRFCSFFAGGFFKLSDFISGNNIELNIVMWAFPAGVFAYVAKKIYGVPYVVWCLGSDIYVYANKPVLRTVIKHILKNASFVFADGVDLAHETEKISGEKCIFLPSASKAEFRNNKIRKNKEVTTLTFVGRIESVKGPDILVDSLISLKKELSSFIIHIVGGGSMLESLKEKVKQRGLEDRIIFYGNITDFQKISDIIRMSDWLIIPSRSDSIPLVFSEAMKCNIPIVASNLADLSYLVKKYRVGYLFKKGDSKSLSYIIKKLPNSTKERASFSKNTKSAALDFSVEGSVENLLNYLIKL